MDPTRSGRPGAARVGCSGWSYSAWRGLVYPAELPARSWFTHYASQFDTVELNTTFYRLPDAATVARWRDHAPQQFTYAVKVNRFATHRKKLLDPESWVENHIVRMEPLGPTLGPHLLQLPGRWRADAGRLDAALAAATELSRTGARWAVEVRDRRWLDDAVLATMAEHGAALCIHDLLADHPWELTAPWTYLRFHGPDAIHRPYAGRYTGRRLRPVAQRLNAWLADGLDVYAYFNNDQGGHAWFDARWLREALDRPTP